MATVLKCGGEGIGGGAHAITGAGEAAAAVAGFNLILGAEVREEGGGGNGVGLGFELAGPFVFFSPFTSLPFYFSHFYRTGKCYGLGF